MYGHKKKSIFVGVASLVLLTFLVVACGSTTGGSASVAATPTCPPNRFKAAVGTLQSISGTTLQVKSAQGAVVQASYTSTTRFQRETTATTSALKGGQTATIAVSQNADNTYTATLITLRGTGNNGNAGGFGAGGGFGGRRGNGTPAAGGAGAGRVPANCFAGQRGAGFPGGNGATGANGAAGANGNNASSARNIAGTIGQLAGSTLTVTDTQGSDYSVTVNSSTKIIQFENATSSALQTGASVTLTGVAASNGSITAQNITILPSGSTTSTRG